jgi:hypothetical protein
MLTFRKKQIVTIEPGPAFDASEWERVSDEIEKSILVGPMKVGREYSFSSFRVPHSWRGERSGVQILPPPDDTPRAEVEMAEHPFILEFPLQTCGSWQITNYRRLREHRTLTLLLNVLLAGRTSLQPRRSEHFWAYVSRDHDAQKNKWFQKLRQLFFWCTRRLSGAPKTDHEIKWVQQLFLAKLGDPVIDELSVPAAEQLEELEPEKYYTTVGHDGKPLRVPAISTGRFIATGPFQRRIGRSSTAPPSGSTWPRVSGPSLCLHPSPLWSRQSNR